MMNGRESLENGKQEAPRGYPVQSPLQPTKEFVNTLQNAVHRCEIEGRHPIIEFSVGKEFR
jgi:hypothetical protein